MQFPFFDNQYLEIHKKNTHTTLMQHILDHEIDSTLNNSVMNRV